MSQKVVIPCALSQAGKDYLINHGFETIEVPDDREDTIVKYGQDAEGIILMTDPFSNEAIRSLPNLKIIARHGVGYDNVDPGFAESEGVWVTITPHANAATVAETTVAELFDVSKNLTSISQKMREGDFSYKQTHMGFDLAGKTLGIMGYGRIGKMVAKKASALDMNILIFDPYVSTAKLGKLVDRDTLLTESDIITLHLVVTPETKKGISEKEFKQMKKTSVLINLGRGALVDQEALITALRTGEIGGAALDVFNEEPLPLTSELYKLENVLLTPHIASNTFECMSRMAVDAASEVVRVLSGSQPQWPVNKKA